MADGGAGSATTVKPDPDHVPLDDEAKALKLEQTKAESRKAIAQAEQAIAQAHKEELSAKLPSTDAKPLEGKIDVGDKSGLPADLLAHSLVLEAADRIAKGISASAGTKARILIVEDRNLTKIDWPYQAVRRQLTQQKRSVQTAMRLIEREFRVPRTGVPPPPTIEAEAFEYLHQFTFGSAATAALHALPGLATIGTLVTAAPAAVGALAAVAGMFHSDYSISPRDVTITTTPLLAAVASALIAPEREVTVAGFHLIRETAISTDFWDAWNERVKLEQLKLQIATRDVAPIEQEIADLQRDLDAIVSEETQLLAATAAADPTQPDKPHMPAHRPLQAVRTEMRHVEERLVSKRGEIASKKAAVAVADAVIQRFDTFATATTTAPSEGGYPPLVAAAIQERLRLDEPQTNSSRRDKRFTHVLFVAVESSGGETVTRRNILLGSRLRYVAGAQFSFLLLDTRTNLTVAAGSDSLLASLKYNLFWYPTGPHEPTAKCLKVASTSPTSATSPSAGSEAVVDAQAAPATGNGGQPGAGTPAATPPP